MGDVVKNLIRKPFSLGFGERREDHRREGAKALIAQRRQTRRIAARHNVGTLDERRANVRTLLGSTQASDTRAANLLLRRDPKLGGG